MHLPSSHWLHKQRLQHWNESHWVEDPDGSWIVKLPRLLGTSVSAQGSWWQKYNPGAQRKLGNPISSGHESPFEQKKLNKSIQIPRPTPPVKKKTRQQCSCGVSSMPSPCIAAIALATAAVSDFGSSQGARTSLEYQFLSCLFLQRQCFFQRRLQINMLHGALQKSCAVRRYPRRRMARVAMSVLLFEGNKKTQQCPSYIYCFLVAAGYCHCHLTASVSTMLVYLDELLPLSRNFGPKHCAVSTEDPINHISNPPVLPIEKCMNPFMVIFITAFHRFFERQTIVAHWVGIVIHSKFSKQTVHQYLWVIPRLVCWLAKSRNRFKFAVENNIHIKLPS